MFTFTLVDSRARAHADRCVVDVVCDVQCVIARTRTRVLHRNSRAENRQFVVHHQESRKMFAQMRCVRARRAEVIVMLLLWNCVCVRVCRRRRAQPCEKVLCAQRVPGTIERIIGRALAVRNTLWARARKRPCGFCTTTRATTRYIAAKIAACTPYIVCAIRVWYTTIYAIYSSA